MQMVDTRCPVCEHVEIDVLLRDKDEAGNYRYPGCGCSAGATVERVHLGHSGYIIGDDIPGGYWVKNGICNPDGSPKRYDTKSSMREAAKAAGLMQHVVHEGGKGSDKSKHTQRFI